MTYIRRQQGTVMQWVDLRPIFEVFTGKGGYEGCGIRREAWCCQGATDKKNLSNPGRNVAGRKESEATGRGSHALVTRGG